MSVVTPNNWGGIYVGIYIERQMQDPAESHCEFRRNAPHAVLPVSSSICWSVKPGLPSLQLSHSVVLTKSLHTQTASGVHFCDESVAHKL